MTAASKVEPVAWRYSIVGDSGEVRFCDTPTPPHVSDDLKIEFMQPLYAAPTPDVLALREWLDREIFDIERVRHLRELGSMTEGRLRTLLEVRERVKA